MNDKNFNWIDILPEDERKAMIESNNKFLESFPTTAELELANREGREAFRQACNIVDGSRISNAIMDLCDLIGGNPHAVIDRRAWEHLLVYIPKDLIPIK